MSKLKVSDFKKIARVSYPTALTFAQKHGEQVVIYGRKTWLIPYDAIIEYIHDKKIEVMTMEDTFKELADPVD